MSGKITLMIIRQSGYAVTRISVPRSLIVGIGIVLFIVMSSTAGFLFSYFRLKQSGPYIQSISAEMNECRKEIDLQEKQIHTLKGGMESLNKNILALLEYEGYIREIANIKRSSADDSLFGVGGSRNATGRSLTESPVEPMDEASLAAKQDWHPQDFLSNESDESVSTRLAERNVLSSVPTILPLRDEIPPSFNAEIIETAVDVPLKNGLVFFSREQEAVVSTADGIVSYVGPKSPYGLLMVIDHGHGFCTRYGLLDKTLKNVGDAVLRGEMIGKTAEPVKTGSKTASAYYEVRLHGISVNPLRYMLN